MSQQKSAGIKDVAKNAKVAIATVDRVIHGRKGVSEKTREKVLKVIEQIGFKPNIMASNLAKNKVFVIGVMLPKVSSGSSYWELPLQGIIKAQKELNQYSVKMETYLFDHSDINDIRKQILNVINSNIDGLIITPKFADEMKILFQDCEDKDRPYVFIDSNIPQMNSLCSIQQPLYDSGKLAAELFSYCFNKGEILILHLKDPMDTEAIIRLKEKGMVDYFRETNSSILTRKEVLSNSEKTNIDKSIKKIMHDMPDIKGIFIPNSKIKHIARYLTEKKGSKIYLIGYDLLKENYEFIDKGVIDFLICSKPKEQGYRAYYLLFEYVVLRKEVKKEVIMPLDIITRMNYKFY
ncbi:MAG: LacI family DNA-binding transcriptional regulator [Bacteroidales bacterium]|nr:LacI family DNA-binding transcriptional regulator [Bacteroidales bacterium]